ncbi:MAG: polysaccharide deacetylase family protein [Clostridia bacterium]|nr:polysaccharide deacetylase family protein [Clostridia bacterium]
MKKIFSIMLAVTAVLFLAACSSYDDGWRPVSRDPESTAAPETVPQSTAPETEVPATETAPPATEPPATGHPATEAATDSPVTEPPATEFVPDGTLFRPKVMMYHLIMEEPYNDYGALFVRPSSFESQLRALKAEGYEFLFAEEWRETDRPSVILTFDDGYEDNYSNMFPILQRYGAKATIFLISDMVGTEGYMNEDQIREMASSGLVSFQSHTANHVDLAFQTEEVLRDQFSRSCDYIGSLTGKPVRALAYPAGSYNDLVLSVAPDYFDFCYTTKQPFTVTEYTPLTIPRYYIAREMTDESFGYIIAY